MDELTQACADNRKDTPNRENGTSSVPAPLAQGMAAHDQGGDERFPVPTADTHETVDWNVHIETPPSRPSRTLTVRFVPGDYRRPKIVDDPQD